jgi:SpoVK/Ycf46/Vps4 family AAA+-type ATPase
MWTQAQIKQFYDDAAAGKFRRNVEKRNEIERDIFEAQVEGRIR